MLGGILAAERSGGGWSGFLPDLAGLAAVSIALGITQALVTRQHQLLSELTARHAQGRILDVGCAVELAAFDDPAFHDRVARATAGAFRASSVVHVLTQQQPADQTAALAGTRVEFGHRRQPQPPVTRQEPQAHVVATLTWCRSGACAGARGD